MCLKRLFCSDGPWPSHPLAIGYPAFFFLAITSLTFNFFAFWCNFVNFRQFWMEIHMWHALVLVLGTYLVILLKNINASLKINLKLQKNIQIKSLSFHDLSFQNSLTKKKIIWYLEPHNRLIFETPNIIFVSRIELSYSFGIDNSNRMIWLFSLQTQNRITVFLCQGKFDGIDWVFKGKKQKTKLDLRPKSDLFQILQLEFKTKSWFFLEKKYQNYIQLQ